MARSNFEGLQVYQLAERLADEIWIITSRWDQFAKQTVGRQLVRACDSIGANIAEGTGRGTYLDNHRFVLVARGSLHETKHWLRRAYRRKLLAPEQIDRLREILDNLSPMLNAYRKSLVKAHSEQRTGSDRSATNY